MFKYSIAISPPDAVIEQVKQMKQKLRGAIGWYPSVGAQAHISFHSFNVGTHALSYYEAYIESFAGEQLPVSLQFDHIGTFDDKAADGKGTFFLAPDENSERSLARMIYNFHRKTPVTPGRSVRPHMSIGRQLNKNQLLIARKLIPDAEIHFVCDDLVLRRFNPKRGQYDIYRRFPFCKLNASQTYKADA